MSTCLMHPTWAGDLIHVNVWQKPLQYCKVISLQLIKINEKEMLRAMATSLQQIYRDLASQGASPKGTLFPWMCMS